MIRVVSKKVAFVFEGTTSVSQQKGKVHVRQIGAVLEVLDVQVQQMSFRWCARADGLRSAVLVVVATSRHQGHGRRMICRAIKGRSFLEHGPLHKTRNGISRRGGHIHAHMQRSLAQVARSIHGEEAARGGGSRTHFMSVTDEVSHVEMSALKAESK